MTFSITWRYWLLGTAHAADQAVLEKKTQHEIRAITAIDHLLKKWYFE